MLQQSTPEQLQFLKTAYVWLANPVGNYAGGLVHCGYPSTHFTQHIPYRFRESEPIMKSRTGFALLRGHNPGWWTYRQDWFLTPLGFFVLGPINQPDELFQERFSAGPLFESSYGTVWELRSVNGFPLERCQLHTGVVDQEHTTMVWLDLVNWFYQNKPSIQNPYWLSV